ncbi:MAG: hypothetical protein ACLQU4_20245 [Limisphaerales bacterium]
MRETLSQITVLAKSSDGGSYPVEFSVRGDAVLVLCHCQAGMNHMVCKHKIALIKGDTKMLFDAPQSAALAQIRAWPQFPATQKRLAEYESALAEIDRELEKVKARERAIKKETAHFLTFGKSTTH